MNRPVLDFADTLYPGLRNKKGSEVTPEESIVAGIAWLADNSEYGIDDAARKLIDEFRAFLHSRAEATRESVLEECARACEAIASAPKGENHGERVTWNHAAYTCHDAIRAMLRSTSTRSCPDCGRSNTLNGKIVHGPHCTRL